MVEVAVGFGERVEEMMKAGAGEGVMERGVVYEHRVEKEMKAGRKAMEEGNEYFDLGESYRCRDGVGTGCKVVNDAPLGGRGLAKGKKGGRERER